MLMEICGARMIALFLVECTLTVLALRIVLNCHCFLHASCAIFSHLSVICVLLSPTVMITGAVITVYIKNKRMIHKNK